MPARAPILRRKAHMSASISAFVKEIVPKVRAAACVSAATLTLSVGAIVTGALPLDSPYTLLVVAAVNAVAPTLAAWFRRESGTPAA